VAVRVAGFAFRRRAEHRRDIVLALDVGLVREVQVTAVRLRFACERGLEILVRLAAVEAFHRAVSFRCCECARLPRAFKGGFEAASHCLRRSDSWPALSLRPIDCTNLVDSLKQSLRSPIVTKSTFLV
jgi:hypothetical protein